MKALSLVLHYHKHTDMCTQYHEMGVEWINRKTVGLVDISSVTVLPSLCSVSVLFFSFAPFSYFSPSLFPTASVFSFLALFPFLFCFFYFTLLSACKHTHTETHTHTHMHALTVMNTSKSKARSSYGLVLKASNVM